MNRDEKTREELLAEIQELENELAAMRRQALTERSDKDTLLENESLILNLLQKIPVDIWARDNEGGIILQNDLSIERWGDFREHAMGDLPIDAETKRLWLENFRRALEGEFVTEEMTLDNGPDGPKHILYYMAPVIDGARVRGVMGIHMDITRNKAVEEDRRLYQFIIEQAGDAVFRVDASGRILYVNQSTCDLMGHTRAELLSMNISDVDPALPPRVWPDHWQRIKQRKTLSFETRLRPKSGIEFPAEITASYLEHHDKEFGIFFARNILEREKAERAIRGSEEKYRLLVEHAQEGICLIQDDRIIYANPALLETSGYTAEDIPFNQPFELVHPDDREKILDLLVRVFRGEHMKPGSTLCRLLRPEGGFWWALISGMLIDWEEKPAVMALISNVTLLKKSEEQLKAALTEKEVLLREIHHRVKNNMQVVSSLLSLQARKLAHTAEKNAFEDIRNRVMAMALVHESLYQSSSLSAIDLNLYINKLVNTLAAAHGAVRRRINLNVDVAPLSIGIDHAMPCGLVLNELIVNALEHAFPNNGPGEIFIRARRTQENFAEILIRDNGIGTLPDPGGKGGHTLGLTLVRGLVEQQLGGHLKMESNNGVRIEVTFPLARGFRGRHT